MQRDFLPRDLKPLLAANGLTAPSPCRHCQTIEETQWLLELAEKSEFIKGVVGWVDLCSPDLPAQLRSACANHSKLVGVRHVVQAEPDDEFMLRDGFSARHRSSRRITVSPTICFSIRATCPSR